MKIERHIAFVGIDPGTTGAACLLTSNQACFHDWVNTRTASDTLGAWAKGFRLFAMIEDIRLHPKDGRMAHFKLGKNFGCWIGILSALGIWYETISPQQWQKTISRLPGVINMAQNWKNNKDRSLVWARALYPGSGAVLGLKKHHNRAEALLMAHIMKLRGGIKL